MNKDNRMEQAIAHARTLLVTLPQKEAARVLVEEYNHEPLFAYLAVKAAGVIDSKWYTCAHCDAGYPDQECTCK